MENDYLAQNAIFLALLRILSLNKSANIACSGCDHGILLGTKMINVAIALNERLGDRITGF